MSGRATRPWCATEPHAQAALTEAELAVARDRAAARCAAALQRAGAHQGSSVPSNVVPVDPSVITAQPPVDC
jgi:hypothetical protein